MGSPHISVGSATTIGGPTSFDFTGIEPVGWAQAEVHGVGFADAGTLSAKINLSGPGAWFGRINSRFHDVFTVTVPGVTPGTPGVMSFIYYVDGVADAIGVPGETPAQDFSVATVTLGMNKYVSDGGTPALPILEQLGSDTFEVINSQSLGGDAVGQYSFNFDDVVSFDVPFEYGVPLALQTTLSIAVATDNDFIQVLFGPYREIWGGGVIENIFVDLFNTAELVAIVNPLQPNATVTGVNFDYSSLVTDSIPQVPIPPALWLLASALAVVRLQSERIFRPRATAACRAW